MPRPVFQPPVWVVLALPDEPDAAESAVPDEPQPASAMTAAATMAVAVMDSFLMPFMLIFFI